MAKVPVGEAVADGALLEAARRGDEVAFLLLYQRHRDSVYRFVRRLSGSRELAEDVTHDCFLSLVQHTRRFEPGDASLRTYLCAAGRNLALSHMRRTGRETSLDDSEDERYRGASDASDGPLEGLLASELRDLVAGAVARLPPLQREALILFDYEEFTLAEIAGVAGTDVGTIKSRLHRARERLRQELTGQLGAGTVHVARRGNT